MSIIHLTHRPLTAGDDHVVWEMICGVHLQLPKRKFPRGHEVEIENDDQRKLGCPTCYEAVDAQATPEQIEAAQLQQQENATSTFDETLGEIESNVEISDAEDDQLISEENEQYPAG